MHYKFNTNLIIIASDTTLYLILTTEDKKIKGFNTPSPPGKGLLPAGRQGKGVIDLDKSFELYSLPPWGKVRKGVITT